MIVYPSYHQRLVTMSQAFKMYWIPIPISCMNRPQTIILKRSGKHISREDAQGIIKNAFICLTKIDQSRAVRNRMTLQEITHILGRKEFGTPKKLVQILNIFREPGNTFMSAPLF
jgi:hypothetical protein